MFMLLGGNEKKAKKESTSGHNIKEARDLFNIGRFPVVTTQVIENRPIAKVLGLVCCRGFDSEEAFFGMAAMAVKKGAQGIIGYNENIAFHPDGSKYFSCFGTAVMFQREGRSDLLSDKKTVKDTLNMIPNAPAPAHNYAAPATDLERANALNLNTTSTAARQNTALGNMNNEPAQSNSAQIAAQLAAEEGISIASKKAVQSEAARLSQQPTEDEDPVLQRLLASQKRQASQSWQQ